MTVPDPIPAYALYGERSDEPDLLHAETIVDRAARHDWRIAPHRHVALSQIFALTAGTARMSVEGEEVALALPALVFMPRGAVHGFVFSQGTEGHVITLPDRAFPEQLGRESPLAARLSRWFVAPLDADTAHAVRLVADEHGARHAFREAALRGAAALLCARVARHAPQDSAQTHSRAAMHLDRYDALIRTHLRERWRIADYAQALNLTPQQLTRVTQAQRGMSASAYLEAQVFREARRLLAYTRMSVSEIGYRLGFDDPAYFSRAFRRNTGRTPSRYREDVDAP
ncbi:Arabinose operon regulatory protein [Roseivivax jejudonensis]|uniref:Arabinose operon regulatory protein n=1 Tax=Roseivivax jejudonensis TaxID=1529041 RepID=A0A1X6YP66_9RHOB|nr:helix-turn-helix domain-containing protein [Roseivivax jejudonensis]SLN26653.1 Arabinose operon regulatory protein [Roseivivax jejudonensis]